MAIDPDVSRLQVARISYRDSNLEFKEGAAENIPGAGGYDVIFSNHVLHWCRDKPKAFSEIGRCLKPGGNFGFQCAIKGMDYSQLQLLSGRMKAVVAEKLSLLDESKLDSYAASVNLKELHHSIHECVHEFKDLAEYRKFFHMHTLQKKNKRR